MSLPMIVDTLNVVPDVQMKFSLFFNVRVPKSR